MKLFIKHLPSSAGVYLFKDQFDRIIYVGKAINLKNRIGSYFKKNLNSAKTQLLVEKISKFEIVKVESEIEALILEAKLIKQYQPEYNSQLKDDKDYLYILISREEYPAVLTGRKQDLQKAQTYFGPFPSSLSARMTLKTIRKIVPFRINCKPNSTRACLSVHLGLCPGVCQGSISAKDYQKNIAKIKRFLNGDTKWVLAQFEKEVKIYSKKQEFEKAQGVQKKIFAIKNITQKVESVEKYLSGPDILESKYQGQLNNLAQILGLASIPRRIECYDISNISGTNSTGSMVVLIDGQISKNDYRRFKIKTVSGINDPAMIKEVLQRRFSNSWPMPDLIIVDGGKSQLAAALSVLDKNKLGIPVVGLAKKLEELHIPNKKLPIRLPNNSPALYLVQKIRDEAHRFAISYHRYLRSQRFLKKD